MVPPGVTIATLGFPCGLDLSNANLSSSSVVHTNILCTFDSTSVICFFQHMAQSAVGWGKILCTGMPLGVCHARAISLCRNIFVTWLLRKCCRGREGLSSLGSDQRQHPAMPVDYPSSWTHLYLVHGSNEILCIHLGGRVKHHSELIAHLGLPKLWKMVAFPFVKVSLFEGSDAFLLR